MTLYLDTTILVGALVEDESSHTACLALLRRRNPVTWTHALAEVYATLTGGCLGIRVPPGIAVRLIEDSLIPRLRLVELAAGDMLGTIRASETAGARGGAIFDYLHLVAARSASAVTLYTLNARHFHALARAGDPRIESPVRPEA